MTIKSNIAGQALNYWIASQSVAICGRGYQNSAVLQTIAEHSSYTRVAMLADDRARNAGLWRPVDAKVYCIELQAHNRGRKFGHNA